MALFTKKTEKIEEKKPKAAKAVAVAQSSNVHVGKMVPQVIIRPRVTEKSHTLADVSNVYIFHVKQGATKGMVYDEIKELYKISPVKIAIVPIPRKSRFIRGRKGFAGGGRKAYVYIKKGEKLEIN